MTARTAPPVIAVFDTETTGVDVWNDRIVSAFVGGLDADGKLVRERRFLINPGMPIPAEATAIHGITDELAATGMQAATGVRELVAVLDAVAQAMPIVTYNASFDWTLVRAEAERHTGAGLGFTPLCIIDPLVIDKRYAKFRRGGRKLTDVAPLYGVEFEGAAHDAQADAVAAGHVFQSMLGRLPGLRGMSHEQLMRMQEGAASEQRESYRSWLRGKGEAEKAATVAGGWPFYDRPA